MKDKTKRDMGDVEAAAKRKGSDSTPPPATISPTLKGGHLAYLPRGTAVVPSEPRGRRIWTAIAVQGLSTRAAAKSAKVSRRTVERWVAKWVAAGWLERRGQRGTKGEIIVKPNAQKLTTNWPTAPSLGSPPGEGVTRLHRSKLKAMVDPAGGDPAGLSWPVMPKDGWLAYRGVVYYQFRVPVRGPGGEARIPVQIVQSKKGLTLIVQSVNWLVESGHVVKLGIEGTYEVVLALTQNAIATWLHQGGVKLLGPLVWVGREREEMEVAKKAHPKAKVAGDVQRDYVAVDQSDPNSPWTKEEEQKLSAFVRLGRVEAGFAANAGILDRIVGILETIESGSGEQMDALVTAVEKLARKDVGRKER